MFAIGLEVNKSVCHSVGIFFRSSEFMSKFDEMQKFVSELSDIFSTPKISKSFNWCSNGD
jgi:hypothetical protein